MNIRRDRGYFYVKANHKQNSWSLYYESHKNGVRSQERVDPYTFEALGIRKDMSLVAARERVHRLNKERSLHKAKVGAGARVVELRSSNETFFPQDYTTEFQEMIEDENFGSKAHLQKLVVHFNFIQGMIVELKIPPREYKENSRKIFRFFTKKKISVSYASKIIGLLNRWGMFVTRKEGSFFEPVKAPRGTVRSAIAEAQKTKEGKNTELGVRTASDPLTPEILQTHSDSFTNPKHFNWLLISLWFGLRPSEIDELQKGKRWSIESIESHGKTWKVLRVYQSKLTGLLESERFKSIPAIYPEQIQCLKVIVGKDFSKPHSKTVRNNLKANITLYGGRKGFTDLMLHRGQSIENISIWLGHRRIETTWRHYKDRSRIDFALPQKVDSPKRR